MPAIRVLPTALKNKIAAGEVVERPASVLKELVENSLDAGCRRIDVDVKKGGRALIRVTDDGQGMGQQDALLSIERHATSKLGSEDDLFNLSTMGFRGEALPSIASVSRMTISTSTEDSETGITLELEGGEVRDSKASPANRGTMVETRDLFYNTPARRKFLKRDSTELMHMVEALTQLSLANPSVGFTLTSDGARTMDLPPAGDARERLTQVYGAEFADELVEIKRDSGDFSLTAYVSKPVSLRERRTHQYLFINKRPVRDPSISHALYGAYDGIAPRDRHPVFFAFVSVPPSEVDFNVHPAKREVRFAHKDSVYRFVRHSVADVLRGPKIEKAIEEHDISAAPLQGAGNIQGSSIGSMRPDTTLTTGTGEYTSGINAGFSSVSEPLPMEYAEGVQHIYLGESFLAYTGKDGLVVMDHHAAHERVLYEKLLKGLRPESHMLLFPKQVKLSHKEYIRILEHRDTLNEFGMEIEDFGQGTVIVRSLPVEFEEADLRGILSEAAAAMAEGERPGRTIEEAVAASIACHSSVRGSRVLKAEELGALIKELELADDPEHCPHGRPTRLVYTTADLRKAFKRS